MSIFDRFFGRKKRDEGISQAQANERLLWSINHDTELAKFLAEQGDKAFLAEDFREWFLARGGKPPHHPNVWGALWMSRAQAGWVKRTGRWKQARSVKDHAHWYPEWISCV